MKYNFIKILKCPNAGCSALTPFAQLVERNGEVITVSDNLQDNDEIIDGLLICKNCTTAYPIKNKIAILLSDNDADAGFQIPLLEAMNQNTPYNQIINSTISRLKNSQPTEHGDWNREEMRYYDKEVDSIPLRNSMLTKIRTIPVWRIFLPRKKHLINFLLNKSSGKHILEIGSGNSRTIFNIFNPLIYNYNYIATDISFKRLMVAKEAIKEGNYIQCSAMNLPFKDETFDSIISFGMLHHLPDLKSAIMSSTNLLKKDGFFLFHEPIFRSALQVPGIEKFKKVITTYQHSEHDGKINLNEAKQILKQYHLTELSLKLRNSAIRAFLESIYNKVSGNQLPSRITVRAFEALDSIFLYTICKVFKSLGPGAAYGIYKRNK